MKKESKLASLKSTSGSGYNYEHIIQGQLLIDFYYLNEYFNNKYYKPDCTDKITFQGRTLGFKTDDFVIEQKEKNILMQITEKSISYTSGSKKFKEFILGAYTDYINNNNVECILVKSCQIQTKDRNVASFLSNLKLMDYVKYQSTNKSQIEKDFFDNIKAILYANKIVISDESVFLFLRHINIITKENDLDFTIEYKNIINNNKIEKDTNDIINLIKEYCYQNSIKGATINYIDICKLFENILKNGTNDVNKSIIESKNKVESINDNINGFHIDRDNIVNDFFSQNKQVNIIYGEPGIGKTAVLKNILMNIKEKYYYVDGEEICNDRDSIKVLNRILDVDNNLTIAIDRAEKLFDNNNVAFFNTIKNKNLKLIFVIRKYSIDKLKESLFESNYDLKSINMLEIENLDEKQVEKVLNKNSIKIKNKKLIEILKNVFYLNNIIIYSNILTSEDEIVDEYIIKEKIYKAITEEKEKYKNALVAIFEKIYNIDRMKYQNYFDEIDYLKNKNIIIENNGKYKFSHDKYDDLVLSYIFECKYENDLLKVLNDSDYNELMLRGINVWLKDKINNDKEKMFPQLKNAICNKEIPLIYKSEIVKLLITEKNLKSFIDNIGVDVFLNDNDLFKTIVASSMIIEPINIISNEDEKELATHDYLTMREFIIPNKKYLDIIAEILSENVEKLEKRHIEATMNVLKAISVYLNNNNSLIYKLEDYYKLFVFLKMLYEDESLSTKYRKEFLELYYYFSLFNEEEALNTLNRIIECKDNRKLSNLEKDIKNNLKDFKYSVSISKLYASKFYKEICEIIMEQSITTSPKEFNLFAHKKHNLYNIEEDSIISPSTFSNQIYIVLREKPKEVFKIINTFLNKIVEIYKSNSPNIKRFNFNSSYDIPIDIDHFVGYRGLGNLPELLKILLMGMERLLIHDLKDENINWYIDELLNKGTSLMQLSIVCSIAKSNPEKYIDLLILLGSYKEILSMDLECTIHDETAFNLPRFNILSRKERESAQEFYDRKKSLWDIFLELQLKEKYKEKIWIMFDNLKEKIGKSYDEIIIKKRLNDFDIRNFIESGKYIKSGNDTIAELIPKPNVDKDVIALEKQNFTKEYVDFIEFENKVKNILYDNKENSFSISELKEKYDKYKGVESYNYNIDRVLFLVIKTKANNIYERFFKEKAKIKIITKLSNNINKTWKKTYRQLILDIVGELFNTIGYKKKIIDYLANCIIDDGLADEDFNRIKNINNRKISNTLKSKILSSKTINEYQFAIGFLRVIDFNDIDCYKEIIDKLISNYQKYCEYSYSFERELCRFLISNSKNKYISDKIYSIIEENVLDNELIEKMIEEAIELVDKKIIDNNTFWNYIELCAYKIKSSIDINNKEEYITDSYEYLNRKSYYNSKIIRLLLLDYMFWNEKASKWHVFNTEGINKYLNIAKMFAELPVGISAICCVIWKFKDNFPSKTILDFSKNINEGSKLNNYYLDKDTSIILEFLIIDLYNKLLNLTKDEVKTLSNIIMSFALSTYSYRVNYIYQKMLPGMFLM